MCGWDHLPAPSPLTLPWALFIWSLNETMSRQNGQVWSSGHWGNRDLSQQQELLVLNKHPGAKQTFALTPYSLWHCFSKLLWGFPTSIGLGTIRLPAV